MEKDPPANNNAKIEIQRAAFPQSRLDDPVGHVRIIVGRKQNQPNSETGILCAKLADNFINGAAAGADVDQARHPLSAVRCRLENFLGAYGNHLRKRGKARAVPFTPALESLTRVWQPPQLFWAGVSRRWPLRGPKV